MHPYFAPYLGYFRLFQHADLFVILDWCNFRVEALFIEINSSTKTRLQLDDPPIRKIASRSRYVISLSGKMLIPYFGTVKATTFFPIDSFTGGRAFRDMSDFSVKPIHKSEITEAHLQKT